MLLDEYIDIKITNRNITHFKNLGYSVIFNKLCNVKIKDLCNNSLIKVNVSCDHCNNVEYASYDHYLSSFNKHDGLYFCGKCRQEGYKYMLKKKYGVENVFQLEKVKEKIKKSFNEKYGVDHVSKIKDVKSKIKEKYNNKTQNEKQNIFIKGRKTKKEKYINGNYDKEKYKETCNEKYGFNSHLQCETIKAKIKQTFNEKYGSDSYIGSIEGQETKEKRMLELYGVKHPIQNTEIKLRIKETMLKKYGVEYPVQNKVFFEKCNFSAFRMNFFKNTGLIYQGTYELDFLEKYNELLIIENGPIIQYPYNGELKFYYSDFYIKKFNLIVEIKSSYTYFKFLEKNIAKKEACINKKYNFIYIINKDYIEFNEKYLK